MVTLAGLRRRLGDLARRRRPRRLVPQVAPLEGRTLQAINTSLGFVKVTPQILPPDGRPTTVTVNGEIASSSPVPPAGFFFVTDEYRTDEPHGTVGPLTLDHIKPIPVGPIKQYYVFRYSFTLTLQASRSKNTPDGRHYYLFVGATDADGTDGVTVGILVPKVFPLPTPKPRASARPR
jgi:hypothetical protein